MKNAISKYQAAFAEWFNVKRAFAFWKGRVALFAILKALDIKAGDEVILPGYTCVMDVNPIKYLGAKPVYVDIEPDTFNMNPALLESKITPATRVIIAQHTYGYPCDMDTIMNIATKRGILVVEDCCLAFGSKYKGQTTGKFGKAAYFSFQWNKPYTTGLGGIAITDDEILGEKIQRLCATELCAPSIKEVSMLAAQLAAYRIFIYPRTTAFAQNTFRYLTKKGAVVGSSSTAEFDPRMAADFFKGASFVQAGSGIRQLKNAGSNIAHRRKMAALYDRLLAEKGWPPRKYDASVMDPVMVRYPVRITEKMKALDEAAAAGVELGSWFECPLHPFETPLEKYDYTPGMCPEAEKAAAETVNLPLHPRASEKTARRTVDFITRFKPAEKTAILIPQLPPKSISQKKDSSVFVTYGWCRTTYAVVLSLGRRGIDVHVSDASSTAMSRYSRYCTSFTKVPDFFAEPDRYFEMTCMALEKTGAKVLLPAHEDVGIFCRRANELPKGVLTALPPWESYRIAEDKSHILDAASRAGCPTPLTLTIHSLPHLEDLSQSMTWPVVLKTHIGNSAKGVRIAHNRDQLLAKFKELVTTFHLSGDRRPIVQEFLPGEAAGVCVLYNDGKCVASFAEQYIRCKEPGLFGTSTLRVPLDNPQLISRAIAVMDKLKWHGVAHLDFVADKYGEFKLIEVNPRLWGALALSVFSGVDFPYLWYLTAIGKAPDVQIPSKCPPIKCRWIAGDYLALIELVKRRMFKEAAGVLIPQRKCYHDDFVLTDPLPFSFELLDYAIKFFRSGGSTNPVIEGMVR